MAPKALKKHSNDGTSAIIRGCYFSLAFFLSVLLISCATINNEDPSAIASRTAGKVVDAGSRLTDAASALIPEKQALEHEFGEDVIDPHLGLSKKDYIDFMRPETPALRHNRRNEPTIPDVSPLVISPDPPTVGRDRLVTLNVTEDVPLKEVLVELARRADVDVEIDPAISGGIIFRARERPFSEVIKRIAELTGLRYSVENGVLKVERDYPYVENYQVDFMNLQRDGDGSINIQTQVLSSTGEGGEGINSGSQNNITSNYQSDLWESVQTNIEQILANYGNVSPGISNRARSTVPDGPTGLEEILGQPTPQNNQPGAVNPAATSTANNLPPTVSGEESDTSEIIPSGSALLSINKQAGIVSVLANSRQHKEVESYLEKVKRQNSAQVLIEAKVVEVELNDNYRSGIDWGLVFSKIDKLPDFSIGSTFAADSLDTGGGNLADALTFTLAPQEVFGIEGLNLESVVQFVEEFGVTRTLSSPRINAVHNQQAVLSFAENFVYFKLDVNQQSITTTDGGEEEDLTISSETQTVPIGVIISLLPSINLTTNEVTMNVRPTLSNLVGQVEDPAVAFVASTTPGAENVSSLVPQIQVRELDSIIKIKSGQVMVIGGLIDERTINTDRGVPYLQDVPLAGNLFQKKSRSTTVVETVIFIKATIVPGYGVEPSDKRLYRTFTNDRRPLIF